MAASGSFLRRSDADGSKGQRRFENMGKKGKDKKKQVDAAAAFAACFDESFCRVRGKKKPPPKLPKGALQTAPLNFIAHTDTHQC